MVPPSKNFSLDPGTPCKRLEPGREILVIPLNEGSPKEIPLGGTAVGKTGKNFPKEDTDTQAEATEDAKMPVGIW